MKNKPLFAKVSVSALCIMLSSFAFATPQIFSSFSTTESVDISDTSYVLSYPYKDENKIDQIDNASFGVVALANKKVELLGSENIITRIASARTPVVGVDANAQSTVVLGSEGSITKINLSSDFWAMGIRAAGPGNSAADKQGALVTINGDSLIINAECTGNVGDGMLSAGTIYGLIAQNATVAADLDKRAKLVVNAKDTIINLTSSTGSSNGLVAMSQGILIVNGNLEVNATNAISTRGGSIIKINESGEHTVILNGDIDFNYDKKTSGTKVDSDVLVNLTGSSSQWTGNAVVSYGSGVITPEEFAKVNGLQLIIADQAQWNPTITEEFHEDIAGVSSIAINSLTLSDGVINILKSTDQVVQIENLSGTGGTINTVAETADGKTVKAGHLSVDTFKLEDNSNFTITVVDGMTADDIADQAEAVGSTYTAVLGKEAKAAAKVTYKEGLVSGAVIADVTSDGEITVQEAQNTVNASLLDIASSNYLFFRSQINDVSARMGDLRSMPKTAGAWVRYYGGQNKYSDRGQKEKYNTLQLGADAFINNNFYLGGTFSYTDGDGTLRNGSTDDKNYNFGIYGGWVGDAGQFVDVIIKRHRVETDFDLYNTSGLVSSGSYHNWGTSASVEAGWRLQCPNTGFYAEPQVELQLGRLDSVNYRTSKGVNVQQDGIDSIIGRAGVAVGYTFPENKGTAYAKASILHDWKGEVKSTFSANGQTRTYKDDLGGTWGEFAVGGTYNPTQNLSAYGQVKTSTGSPVRNHWQVSVGLRYNF